MAIRLDAIATTRLEAIATRVEAIATGLEAMAIRLEAIATRVEAWQFGWRPSLLVAWRPSLLAMRLEATATGVEAIAIRLETIATRVEAIATSRLEAMAIRVEAIAIRLEASAIRILFLLQTDRHEFVKTARWKCLSESDLVTRRPPKKILKDSKWNPKASTEENGRNHRPLLNQFSGSMRGTVSEFRLGK